MIRRANKKDAPLVARLALQLWPSNSIEEFTEEYEALLGDPNAAVFLYEAETALGFAQCQLRRDYVEGTQTSPVGYLEGIYVTEGHRNRKIASGLLAACEQWAREQRCAEFASDCELDNTQSLAFHLHTGFTEANRIICFTKKL